MVLKVSLQHALYIAENQIVEYYDRLIVDVFVED